MAEVTEIGTEAAADEAAPPPERLGDEEVAARLARLEEVLGTLEGTPGRTAETALDAVGDLVELYGEALARVIDRVPAGSPLATAVADDPLVGHLLALHGVHPAPVEQRILRALEEVRPYLRSHGGDVELAGIEDDVVRVRLTGGCGSCASSAATIRLAVEDAVLAAVPELSAVQQERPAGGERAGADRKAAAFIPAEALLRHPAAPARTERTV
ncbi:NifU family protein [Actinomadura viridis]|uniref:NifU family protein n=1 Tax=Actinomadura viridis TaxID=58110 RepID=UPI00368C0C08